MIQLNKKNLNNMNIKQLKDILKKNKIKGFSKLKKQELINLILKNKKKLVGSGEMPEEKVFYQGAKSSYEKKAYPLLDENFKLLADTPTFDAYINTNTNTILVNTRGTKLTDPKDLKADASLLFNNLKNTNRYQMDKKVMEGLAQNFPADKYDYYISGHSLGKAIMAQLMRDFPFIKKGVAYNGAFQTFDLKNQNPNIKTLYTDSDFLYNLGGKLFKNIQVIPTEKAKGFFGKLRSLLPVKPVKGLQGHKLENFAKLYGMGDRSENTERTPLRRPTRTAPPRPTRRAPRVSASVRELNREQSNQAEREQINQVVRERLRRIENELAEEMEEDLEDIMGREFLVRIGNRDQIPVKTKQQEEPTAEGSGINKKLKPRSFEEIRRNL